MIWAYQFTGTTSTAFFLVDVGGEWLQGDVPGIHQRQGGRGSCTTLGDTIRDILRPLAGARQVYTIRCGLNRRQFGVFFKEETVRTPADAEGLSYMRRICLGLNSGAQ